MKITDEKLTFLDIRQFKGNIFQLLQQSEAYIKEHINWRHPELKSLVQIERKEIINDAQKKDRNSFLSRLYYNENDFKKAYEHSSQMRDATYLELLAKKLSTDYPELSCDLFRRLCFDFINSGSWFILIYLQGTNQKESF